MNTDRLINMLTRMFVRKAMNKGIKAGVGAMSKSRTEPDAADAPPGETGEKRKRTPEERAERQRMREARQATKRARQAAKMARRVSRF